MLNLDRVHIRRTWEITDGLRNANSKADLDYEWFEAKADSEEEAMEMQFEENAIRESKRSATKVKGFFGA